MIGKEIKINNSRLKLVCIADSYNVQDDKVYFRLNKKKVKYQFVVCIEVYNSLKLNNTYIKSCYGKSLDYIFYRKNNSIINDTIITVWCIEIGDKRYEDEQYDPLDIKIIMSFIGLLFNRNIIDTTEELVSATRDEKIITGFYSSYGSDAICSYLEFLKEEIKKEEEYKITPIKKPIKKCYDRNKYSVQALLQDLLEDSAEILIDPDLLGEYKNISPREIEDDAIIHLDRWGKIKEILGNQRRPNLSIRFDIPVGVYIPKNPYDIEEGYHDFKRDFSICIIKDGMLYTEEIAVKISEKLTKKLKPYKIIKGELLRENEYLLDLTKLALISKSWIRGCSRKALANLEVEYRLANMRCEYLDIVYPQKTDISDKEKFLNSLGIFGDYYIPVNKKEHNRKNFIDKYYELETLFLLSGFNYPRQIREEIYNNYHNSNVIPKGVHELGEIYYKYLDSIKIEENCKKDLKGYRKKCKEELKSILTNLRDRKFQLFMGKSFISDDFWLLTGKSEKVKISNTPYVVEVSWAIKTIIIND